MTTESSMFLSGALPFLQAFNAWLPPNLPAGIDHVCYKCGSTEEYERIRRSFEPDSRFIYQSMIAGRRIAVISLPVALVTALGKLTVLELSDQKPDGSQRSGFDHVEIYPVGITIEELVDFIEAAGTAFEKVERPHHTTYDAKIFSDFKVRLEDRPLIDKIKDEELH